LAKDEEFANNLEGSGDFLGAALSQYLLDELRKAMKTRVRVAIIPAEI
jgi:hypothetical protein